MNMRWLNFPFQPNINVETTLGHQHWINVTLSTLFQRCFVNAETTSTNIRRLNFHFQPNFNDETTLVHRRWVDAILSTLFCQRWNTVDKCTSVQLSFSTKHQHWNNVDERWQINVVSTLMCLLGCSIKLSLKRATFSKQVLLHSVSLFRKATFGKDWLFRKSISSLRTFPGELSF